MPTDLVSVLIPQITYVNADGPQTLLFVYPPTSKPIYNKKATRTDIFSTAGNRQTQVERVNESFPIQMKTILMGDDSDAWRKFLDWAVQGGAFEYYPDSTNADNHFTMFLVEPDAQLAFSSPGVYTFAGTFQKEIT